MRRRLPTVLILLATLALGFVGAGCGEEEEGSVREGEALELGEMSFNVQITRFLNPASPEDSAYLRDAPPLTEGNQYLGVFMQVTNDGEEPNVVPYPMKIVDTRGDIYIQERVENAFTLDPGTPVEPDDTVPGPETAAAAGPVKGALLIFVVPENAVENRPLELEIPGPEGVGIVELDI